MLRRYLAVAALATLAVMGGGEGARGQNLYVVRVASDTSVALNTYTSTGASASAGAAINFAATGTGALTLSFTATSEGALTVSENGQYLGLAGYRTGTNASATDRVITRVTTGTNAADTSTVIPNAEGYTANNIRGAVWTNDGSRYYASGTGTPAATGGVRTNTFGTTSGTTQLSASPTNVRVVSIAGGQVYASSAAGTNVGLNTFGTGLPTTSGQTVTLVTPATGTGTPSPYGFQISPDGLTAYVADDRTIANGGGIQKFTRTSTGSNFILATTFGTTTGAPSTVGARGVTVDFNGTNPIIYATTADATANRLISFADIGGTQGTVNLLDTAGTNQIFRGVAFIAPVPEPATVLAAATLALGGVGALRRRRVARLAPVA